MLPSTGYFKAINCPFYESGTCDRPYCHFKHSKRDVGVTAETSEAVESGTAGQVQESKSCTMVSSGSDVLQKLVTEAVKKVLANQDATNGDKFSCQNVVSQVVEGLTPTLTSGSSDTLDTVATNTTEKRVDPSTSLTKPVPCVYNPTPIAELKKRHIPIVSYMPTRESRVAVKRKCSPDGTKPWLARGCEAVEPPRTGEIKYKPTVITNSEIRDATHSYVPTYKSESASTYFYNDESSNDYLFKLREPYYPKCKKRREEYVPKKVKAPLKTSDGSNKSALDTFEGSFDTMGEASVHPKSISTIPSSESFQYPRLDVEPKFSDDDDVDNDDEDGGDFGGGEDKDEADDENEGKEEDNDGNDRKVNKIVSENADRIPVEGNEVYGNVRRLERLNKGHDAVVDTWPKINVVKERDGDDDKRNCNGKISRNSNVSKQEESLREESTKLLASEGKKVAGVNSDREHKRRDKSKEKNVKSRDSSHKRYKEKHDSNDTSRSASHSRSKSRSRARHDKEKESKDAKRDRDKSRHKDHKKHKSKEKERERGETRHRTSKRDKREEDYQESGKRDERESKNRSGSPRRQERVEKRNCESNHSKTNRKSDDRTSGRFRAHTDHKKRKCSTDRSASDDEDEENSNNRNSIVDVDLTFSTSDSDHDVQEECLKIFQEYQVSERPKTTEASKESSLSIHEKEHSEEVGRKRVAHPSAAVCVTRHTGVNQQGKKLINPQQKMYERWRLMREALVKKTTSASGGVGDGGSSCWVGGGGEEGEGGGGGGDEGTGDNCDIDINASTGIDHDGDRDGEDNGSSSNSNVTKDVPRNSVETRRNRCNNELKLNGGNGRVRIAHVPYGKSLAIEGKKMKEKAIKLTETKVTDNQKTAAQTAKSGLRIAHVPQVIPQLIRPEPLQVATQKFPLNVRQYYVNMMHDICVSIYTNAEDAAQRAVKEEHACHERCKALAVYKNSCMLAAHRLKKEIEQNQSATATTSGNSVVSHEAVLAGKTKGSWSVIKTKKCVTDFKGVALYGMLKKWIMTEQQLRDNGFPRPHPDGQKGRAKVYVINSRNQSVLSKVPNERICCRCGQTYMINKYGFALQPQNCIYHWGRKFTIRGEGKYSCCQQYGSATGCCVAKTHVWDYTDYENLRGYVKTLSKGTPAEEQGVYALDCEMCYTTQGLELTRITIIDEDCNVVYEALVKPQNPIIDYNTRFSGITEESMKDVTTTLLDVQATILTMFSDKTILVGHSLESDFKSLRLLHDTVVDTSVMFPHKNGYPQKRALKNLCSEYLRKLIQNDVGGHDSKEDAMACMELILWKAKEEAKLQ
ncbi:uncharacterized protein LOC100879141 isoform X2 [Megachile rotundata]|uniref:uncharacterized protein LOC100879141 isoform X2 n=1 Tax=Megachile rotundata TaxID=143995 RepID=UPI0006150E7C|nr:PREDICTED: uncharacterized protein LOC100879141 isoform X2 [Megachile rotundata]